MDEKLLRFFKLINFNDLESFSNSHFIDMTINKSLATWKVRISSPNVIPVISFMNLKRLCSKGVNDVKKIDIIMEYEDINPDMVLEYFIYFLSDIIDNNPSLVSIDKNEITIDDEIILVKVSSLEEEKLLKKEVKSIVKKMEECGLNGYIASFIVDDMVVNETKKEIAKNIANVKIPKLVNDNNEKKNFFRKKVEYEREGVVPISSLIKEENAVNLEAYIFDTEFSERKKKDGNMFYMVTLKISDNSSSILAKCFCNDEEEYLKYSKELKKGKWYHFIGQVRQDDFAHDLVFRFNSYVEIDTPVIKRKDNALKKRVELHSHTKMSQMDGVCDEIELVRQAMEWGHAGIAITDHDCTQSFPHVFNEVTSFNKKAKAKIKDKIKENEETIEELNKNGNIDGIKELEKFNAELKNELENYKPFKAAYGVELMMFDSKLNIVFNPKDELLENKRYVVFDTETTGFNPGLGDSMIEIGAVMIENGEVLDRFDELINPGHHIDEAITRVTNISDDDVKDADNEENVVKRFKEWIKDYTLVAHNAKFDKNMLDMAYYKYNLGKLENSIIDTLNLSRVINRDLKKHSLAALGKFYGIDTGEADSDDEEGLSNNVLKFTDEENAEIKDILVDGISIVQVQEEEYNEADVASEMVIKKTKKNKFIDTVYKKSKTDKVKIEMVFDENIILLNKNTEFELHPAENNITIKYLNQFGEQSININIYVGQHHGADVDSENTAYIFNKMLNSLKGINNLMELNDDKYLEYLSYINDPKKMNNIVETLSYKNYLKEKDDKEYESYPLEKYNNYDYIWKYPWCKDDNLQMYENIPGKTFNENFANTYDSVKHICMIAINHSGLKNIFKLVSFANTNFNVKNAKIPRRLVNEYRKDCLVGSSCLNGEVFNAALTRNDEELKEIMNFYDYIEVQPLENYSHLLKGHDIDNLDHLKFAIKKIIKCAKELNKIIVATGDVHHIEASDRLYREIIVNQNVPGKGRHILTRYLSGSKRNNINIDNVNRDIELAKKNGSELSNVDIKILKLIYALSNVKSVKTTAYNLYNIYSIDKKNEEEAFIKNDDDKKYLVDSSLRKLQITGIVTIDFNTGEYKLVNKYNKRGLVEIGHIPNQYFRTTNEMLEEFKWLKDKALIEEIVIDNPNKIIDMLDEIEVVVYPEKPYSPIIEGSQETTVNMVYEKAQSMYGNPLPRNIEERLAQEFYGDKITLLVKENMKLEFPNYSDEEIEEKFSKYLHEKIVSGYDEIVKLKKEELLRNDPSLSEDDALEKAKMALTGIIGGGFDVIYLIAQKLVKHSNDDGYLVGSRGSVGSSLVASMMGITECNGLPAHYYCPKCCYSEFNDSDNHPYSENYPSGFDLPNKECPKCGTLMIHQGNDMPFATFLGFAGEKVPDIDLNFSGLNQADAHEYTKVLFGTDNVYRAGTIATVADKTAYGYVQGFFEERSYNDLKLETSSYGLKITGKDELKKLGVIESNMRSIEVERLSIGCTGVKRTTGQHPGGIVVVPGYKDIWDFTPFQYPADDPTAVWRTTHFDYHAIDADLLKLDILGHDDPTVLRMLQDLSGLDVTKIDLGDLDTMKIFTGPEILGVKPDELRGLTLKDKDGNVLRKYCPTGTLGIPEFGTSFLLGMLEETKPTTFAELIKISGLSHGTDVWLGNAHDLCTPNEDGIIEVPFKNVIGCRDDIMVNLIQFGLPPAKAFKIMEFVRKGKPSKDPATWREHAEFMRSYNVPEWYIESCRKIQYMFPKAHATAYVTSAFRIAWFKVHHPIWYYCAYLSIRRDQFDIESMIAGPDAIRRKIDEIDDKGNAASNKEIDTRETLCLCLEATLRGIYFKNIDVALSDSKNFVITEDNKGLIIPFCALDGLGENVAKGVIKAREEKPFISQEDLQVRGKINGTSMEKLRKLGCLNNLSESNQMSLF